jgi:hypothetical protein
MLAMRKRLLIATADKLGWLNWADPTIVAAAIRTTPSVENVANQIVTLPGKSSSRGKSDQASDDCAIAGNEPDDDAGVFRLQIVRQFSADELANPQPGPVFAQQPEVFIDWVRAGLSSLRRQREVGIESETAAKLGRETRIWIATGFLGIQTNRSRRHLPALVRLWREALALEDSKWSAAAPASTNRSNHQ